MAEFSTFDLGRVLQTAQAVKGSERDAVMDRLRTQYLGQQIKSGDQQMQFNAQNQAMQMDTAKAQQALNLSSAALASPDPKSFIEQNKPDFVQVWEQTHGPGSWTNLDPAAARTAVQGIADHATAVLGPAKPIEVSQGTTLVDPRTNKPLYTNPKQHDSPTSYDEFSLAQKDPAFANFLKSRRGKGVSMTMPDGTVVQIGGEGGEVGPGELGAPTRNKLQEAIVQGTDELDRLNSVGNEFDPKFLQIPGRLKGAALRVKDLAGGVLGELSPDESAYLNKFSTFKANASKNLSTILNRLSGAAISPAEGDRLKKGIPNDEDSPTQFIAKYQAAVKDSTRAIMRANWALKNGIGVKSVEDLSKTMPLGSIDQVYQSRANEIWQGLGGTPESRQQAVQQANQEFGVHR